MYIFFFPPSVFAFEWIKMNIVAKRIDSVCKEFRFIRPFIQHMHLDVELQLKLLINNINRKQNKTNHTRGNMDINIHNPLKIASLTILSNDWEKARLYIKPIDQGHPNFRGLCFSTRQTEKVLCRSHQMTSVVCALWDRQK